MITAPRVGAGRFPNAKLSRSHSVEQFVGRLIRRLNREIVVASPFHFATVISF
jgi:hypothetical protein